MRLVVFIFGCFLAMPAEAQDWATRDVCDIKTPYIVPEALAPNTLEELEERARRHENGVGKYWRVISPEGEISHLWGTLHSSNPVILALPKQVETEIKHARVVAVEYNFIFESRDAFQEFTSFSNQYNDANNQLGFSNLDIPNHVKTWIRNRLVGLGWDSYAADYLTFAALSEKLMGDPCNDFHFGSYPIQDTRIQMLGDLSGAAILGLEPVSAFRGKLNAPSNAAIAEAVIATYGAYLNPHRTADDTAAGFALYLMGQVGVMMELDLQYIQSVLGVERGQELLKRVDSYMLYERNQRFLERALFELEKGGVFMAIGSFHLPRKTGMVALLRDAGFTVERIALPDEVQS